MSTVCGRPQEEGRWVKNVIFCGRHKWMAPNETAIQNVCLIRELYPSPTQDADPPIRALIPYCSPSSQLTTRRPSYTSANPLLSIVPIHRAPTLLFMR